MASLWLLGAAEAVTSGASLSSRSPLHVERLLKERKKAKLMALRRLRCPPASSRWLAERDRIVSVKTFLCIVLLCVLILAKKGGGEEQIRRRGQ